MTDEKRKDFISQEEVNALLSGAPLMEQEGNQPRAARTARLHNWYLEKVILPNGDETYIARGNVTGHYRIMDTCFIHTSNVLSVEIEEEKEEAVIQTRNTVYFCRLSECDYSRKDTYDRIPRLSEYSEKYGKYGESKECELEDNSILLVLSDHREYYFETALIKENGRIFKGEMRPHIGIFQDSCLLYFHEFDEQQRYQRSKKVDIRYFPHNRHLETYGWDTDGMPVYLENTGESIIYYTIYEGVIELKPGERKLASRENCVMEDDKPLLAEGDLYPAFIIDDVDN